MENNRFDIEKVHSSFEACLKDECDVILDQYLEGYKELYKYVRPMTSMINETSF